ncbi:hypothetical protein EJ08DRAFT_654452 [Tothia fuscella]|uniref:Uncharacterized protein n=1 Tax=Tothia fuscella TaxID=1048955 RepID=A0A9P4NEX8_9PEZI|nr:hypothetical protein EJ08DRAFT_654452 [Tothia fuscella]
MPEVKRLRILYYQFVFLTATLPASLVPHLYEALLLERPLLIRSVSARADLETRALADKIANRLGCPIYYSDSGTAEEKAAVLGR